MFTKREQQAMADIVNGTLDSTPEDDTNSARMWIDILYKLGDNVNADEWKQIFFNRKRKP